MARRRHAAEVKTPALYAMVQPGLEPIAADEITRDLGGEVRRVGRGLVVFRVETIDNAILNLRTVEDVFLYAWGSNELSYRATDLDLIQQWTAKKANWNQFLQIHRGLRPKSGRGRPSYWIVTQMRGEHGYRRADAREAFGRGLARFVPETWRVEDQDADVEFWLTIQGAQAVCGLRLSDRTMRHRTYKLDHRPASLRPSVAAAMVRLAGTAPGMTVLDPMCGAGTILAEQLDLARRRKAGFVTVIGGDLDKQAVEASGVNVRKMGPVVLARWDARHLPLEAESVDRIVSNPPFGVQLLDLADLVPLYRTAIAEYDRVLRPGGRAVLLVAEQPALNSAARAVQWKPRRQLRVRVQGQRAVLSVWEKPL